jgi:hypothetical protein
LSSLTTAAVQISNPLGLALFIGHPGKRTDDTRYLFSPIANQSGIAHFDNRGHISSEFEM